MQRRFQNQRLESIFSRPAMFQRFRLGPLRLGFADVLFVFFTITILQYASRGMMDDPGLGWHLRIPDLMIEQGGFVYEEYFSSPSQGNRWVTRAWLSDFLMRAAYGLGGLNGVALLTSLVFALTLRLIYSRIAANGVHPIVAAMATYFGLLAIVPSFLARPNIFAFLGIWLVADLLTRFHAGKIKRKQLTWLIPIMLLWTNLHGSFLAGLVLIAIAWTVEGTLSTVAMKNSSRQTAKRRVMALTLFGAAAGLATLVNPNGLGLHLYNLSAVTDPFIQNNSTKEWLPPDFRTSGFFKIELMILALPILAATCRKRINLVGIALTVAWLHFALTGRRYTTLWVVLALPTICELASGNLWLVGIAKRLRKDMSDEVRDFLKTIDGWIKPSEGSDGIPGKISGLFTVGALLIAGLIPPFAKHHPEHIPANSLDNFLAIQSGEPTFHDVNWGGYLTWKGWDQTHRFRTWIDDRIEVHGTRHLKSYLSIIRAEAGWHETLISSGVQYICVSKDSQLAKAASNSEHWRVEMDDELITVFKFDPSTAEALAY